MGVFVTIKSVINQLFTLVFVCHAVFIPLKKTVTVQMVKSQVSWTRTHEDLLCIMPGL